LLKESNEYVICAFETVFRSKLAHKHAQALFASPSPCFPWVAAEAFPTVAFFTQGHAKPPGASVRCERRSRQSS
jgi:hypothetical protein